MNVLLINMPHHNFEHIYPFTLGYIASLLQQKEYLVYGVDVLPEGESKIFSCLAEKNVDCIGLSISSLSINHALSLCSKIKKACEVKIVVFGDYITLLPQEVINKYNHIFDIAILGNPEYAFVDLCEKVKKKSSWEGIDRIIKEKSIKVGEQGGFLDSLPFPNRDIFPLQYYYGGMLTKNKRYVQIITSRGCQHGCYYCIEPMIRNKWYERSPQNVVDEIKLIKEKYDIREFHIEDKNIFAGNSERVKMFCQYIMQEKIVIDWQCAGVIPLCEFNDLSVIDDMAQAGCYNISVGVESFDNDILNTVGRNQEPTRIEQVVKRCKKNKIEVSCHLMIGIPGQTTVNIKKDIQWSRKYPFDFIHYNIFQYVPGAKIYTDHILIENQNGVEQLKKMQRKAYMLLMFKKSILLFVIRRMWQCHNIRLLLKKWWYYMFGDHQVHI